MTVAKLILDTRTAKHDGTYPVKLSIRHRTTSLLGLDISILKEQWSGKDNVDRPESKILSGIEIINHPKAKFLNGILRIKLNQAETMILNLSASGKLKKLSQAELIYFIQTNDTEPAPKKVYGLEDHFCKYIANCRATRTTEIYQETLDKIKKYSPGATFEEVNLIWLRAFDNHLAETCGTNTRAIHMRNIRAVFNDAINEDLVSLNLYPFRKFKIKTERTIKRTLSIAQIKQFRDYPCEKSQERYRDLFMLIFYLIGINLVDLLRLRHDDLRNGRIEYIRAKTGRPYSIEVLPEAIWILNKYKGKDFLLNVSDDYHNYKDFAARINENIKEIGITTRKGRGGKITRVPLFPELIIYTARRSWATIAAKLDIPLDTIAASLGHGENTTTHLYVNFDLKKVDKANRDVLLAIK